ncbi:mitochondrial inner membrane protein OXA1L-like isoform X2 [Lycorma delicatula]|uniref:mitochondrial inner membrane protein OXA1L-like isoform X2 n=1 Tax=Lycorma delicatula TaxID=130591 RepID=UPI003F514702
MFGTSKCILRNKKFLETVSYKIQNVSYLHISKNYLRINEKRILLYGLQTFSRTINKPSSSVRLLSTDVVSDNINIATPAEFPIPDPPSPPAVTDSAGALSEPLFQQLGLGGWSPAGMVQQGFELLHISLGLPWWECIMIGTVVVRSAMFPLVVMSQRNAARLANNQPYFQEIQEKINQARQRGEQIEAARYTQDLVLLMREKGINPLSQVAIPLAQTPVFLSFFWGLREMANIPVKSMRDGGLFWFTDLTVPDQFYLLPVITSASMLASIEIGADSSKITTQNHFLVKYLLRCIPLIIFPFTINFPGGGKRRDCKVSIQKDHEKIKCHLMQQDVGQYLKPISIIRHFLDLKLVMLLLFKLRNISV